MNDAAEIVGACPSGPEPIPNGVSEMDNTAAIIGNRDRLMTRRDAMRAAMSTLIPARWIAYHYAPPPKAEPKAPVTSAKG